MLLRNIVYDFGSLLHSFNDCSFNYHIVTVIAQNVLWSVRRWGDVLSIYQLHSVQRRAKCPTDAASVPQHHKLVYALLDKAPNVVIHQTEVMAVWLFVELTDAPQS